MKSKLRALVGWIALEEGKFSFWKTLLTLVFTVWLITGSLYVKAWCNPCFRNDETMMRSRLISGILVDVYTPKGGKGLSMSGGVFRPQGNVTLYTEVTNNTVPVPSKEVVLEVYGPKNPYYNFSVYETATTNASGIASASFVIPFIVPHNQEITFGVWSVSARARFGEQVFYDDLTLEVGYIIEIVSVATGTLSDEEYWTPNVNFSRGERLDVKLTVKSIASSSENVWFSAMCSDRDGKPIAIVLKNFTICGKTTEEVFLRVGYIPCFASVGKATVGVGAYDSRPWEGGRPYGPGKSTKIVITEGDAIPPSMGTVVREPEGVQPYQEVIVSVNVTDAQTGVKEVLLCYRVNNSSKSINVKMNKTAGDTFAGSIPGLLAETHVSYVVYAFDYATNIARSPNTGYNVYMVIPEFSPFQILLLIVVFTTTAVLLKKKKFFFS